MQRGCYPSRSVTRPLVRFKAVLFAFVVVALLSFNVTLARAQRPGPNSSRATDMARAIINADLYRQLLLAPLPVKKDADHAKLALMKQIRNDFREIQTLNNKMMADAWSKKELDYHYLSAAISWIRGKANRLKSNLALPKVADVKMELPKEVSSADEFRAGLLQLDRTLTSFVKNPLFQKAGVLEANMANLASHDLNAVIELSGNLKKIALQLGQSSNLR